MVVAMAIVVFVAVEVAIGAGTIVRGAPRISGLRYPCTWAETRFLASLVFLGMNLVPAGGIGIQTPIDST
jgi:hypothetical protein